MRMRYLIAALLIGVLAACEGGTTTEYETLTISDSLINDDGEQAEAVDLQIDSNIQDVNIQPVDDGDTLLSGSLDIYGDLVFDVSGGTRRNIRVDEESSDTYIGGGDLNWDFELTNTLPINLDVEVNSADANLELAGHQLTGLTLETNSGAMDASLPATDEAFDIDGTINSGEVNLRMPEGHASTVTFDINSGALGVDMEAEGRVTVNLEINSGEADFNIPAEVPIRLDVRNNNSGDLTLMDDLRPVSTNDDGDEGIWETGGFDPDANGLTIIVNEINSGSVRVR